jgi:hypothetical protein
MIRLAAIVACCLLMFRVVCLGEERKAVGPLISREEFFASLDYSIPGLEAVQRRVQENDYEAAAQALLDYMRSRRTVKYFVNSWDRPSPNPNYDTSKADDILNGIPRGMLLDWFPRFRFEGPIQWDASPFRDREWFWILNRHEQWNILSQAYWGTGDEKYTQRFVEELTDWIKTRPVVTDGTHNSSASWRTIEAGIRMFASWPAAWQRFLTSPNFTPEANLLYLMSLVDHARHLERNPTGGNWLTMEMNGLLHVAILFPEFKESARWRIKALDILNKELDKQVYPDGMQYELTTGYHQVALDNFLMPVRLCELNGISLPEGYLSKLERMYDAIMYLTKPSGFLPATNDSDAAIEKVFGEGKWADGRRKLKDAAIRYSRSDLLYVATNGEQGTPPGKTSHTFPYAGFYVMRQGWTIDSLYLVFDAGPFGAGHQHEDKLSFEAYAYGETLLFDPGRFSYADPVFHPYALSTAAHNTAMVDGQGQARQRQKPEDRKWVVSEPLSNPWISQPDFDYVEGVYDEGYGPQLDRSVTHRRAILFVKNDYWIVLDRFDGSGTHVINTLFHFAPGKVIFDTSNLVCTSVNDKRPNVLIVPSDTHRTSLSIVEGRESPCQGWISTEYNRWVPAPVADYAYDGALPMERAYLIYPMRPGEKIAASIEKLGLKVNGRVLPNKASAYAVRFKNGRTEYILLAHGVPGVKRFAEFETDGDLAVVREDAFGNVSKLSIHGATFFRRGAQQFSVEK